MSVIKIIIIIIIIIAELKNLDRKTRKFLTMNGIHHPKSDVDRLYLPRQEGGRGLVQIENSYKISTVGLEKYLREKDDQFLKAVLRHENAKKKYSIVKQARKFMNGVQINEERDNINEVTDNIRKYKKQLKHHFMVKMKETWEEKPLHGQYPKRLEKADTDKEATNKWLRSSGLKGETEGFIIAAQDQSLPTKLYHHQIIKDGSDPKCRLCNAYNESVDHLISGCPVLAKKEYIERHNTVAGYVHWNLCKHYNMETKLNWYEHNPLTVVDNQQATILWDMPIHTDREISANRPDIIVKDKSEQKCYLIDISVPNDQNVGVKELEKRSKYKDLEIEISRMWGMKVVNVPVIIGALGLVKKGMEKNIKNLPGTIRIEQCQKTVLLKTAHILRKALSL